VVLLSIPEIRTAAVRVEQVVVYVALTQNVAERVFALKTRIWEFHYSQASIIVVP